MATESPKLFFSYAREDSEFVLKLARELRDAGVNLWLDQLDIRGGHRWDEAVQAALESCQGMVAVLSPSAVASQNFLDEVSYALEERKQVIPLLYRECGIPFRLRRVQYVNFTSSYEDGFADLLRALESPKEEPHDATTTVAPPRSVPGKARHEAFRHRMIGALVGAVAGSITGGLVTFFLGNSIDRSNWVVGALLSATLWAISGVITGTNRRLIAVALIAALAGAAFACYEEPRDKFFLAIVLGAPLGAFSAALAILLWSIALAMLKRFQEMGATNTD
jgi:hypothetical protein